jgi:hypothetical protein
MRGPWGYPKAVVETVLGLLGLVLFIVGVISLAAGVTWTVVKITPAEKRSKPSGDAPAS